MTGITENHKCHGSTFSALYLMSRLEGENHNSLVAYGDLDKLKIPVFSGECFRGIADNGVNREHTSWSNINDVNLSFSYANKFPFSIEDSKIFLKDIISDNNNYLKELAKDINDKVHIFSQARPRYGMDENSSYWNKIILKIRQVRAWDETLFQQEFKEGLTSWINEEKSFRERPQFINPTEKPIYQKLVRMIEEINSPLAFQVSQADKLSILKAYPIIFFTKSVGTQTFACNEVGIAKKLKLGEDIDIIATSSEHISEIRSHLSQQGLAEKISLVSFETLGLEK